MSLILQEPERKIANTEVNIWIFAMTHATGKEFP